MRRTKTPALEVFQILKAVTGTFSEFETALKRLRKKRFISQETWKGQVLPANNSLAKVLDQAWTDLYQRTAAQAFPELVREDQVTQQFQISQTTLYRRRKKREIAYIKDSDGTIWYPIFDLLDYVLKSKSSAGILKPGRPRKF